MRRPTELVGEFVSKCGEIVARWRHSDTDGTSLEAVLLQELLGTAALVAASASIATALRDTRPLNYAASELDIWLPGAVVHFEKFSQEVNPVLVHRQLFTALRAAYGLVDFARELSFRLFKDGEKRRTGGAHAEVVCDAWLRACGHLLIAIYEFQRLRPGLVSDPSFARVDGVVKLLNSARAGQAPCVSADGCVSVGSWAERRASIRYGLDMAVTLYVAGEAVSARLTDVGAGGLGLAGLEIACAKGEAVLVTLPSGRELAAEVRWQRDDRVGLALFDALALDDELFTPLLKPRPQAGHARRHH